MSSQLFYLLRIEDNHFVAGAEIEMDSSLCVRAAPIIKYMVGWTEKQIVDYCSKKDYKINNLKQEKVNGSQS